MSLASHSRLIAATLMIGAIAAPAASAQSDLAPPGTPSGAPHLHGNHFENPGAYICGTNYTMNSVDGKYCPPRHGTHSVSLTPASAAPARGSAQSQATTGAPVVRPNPDQQTQPGPVGPPILRRARASELPAIERAQAQEAERLAHNLPRTAPYSNTEMNAYASAAHPVAAPTPISSAPSNGFDYGAAAAGAGITGAIVLLITASTLTIRRRSQLRHP